MSYKWLLSSNIEFEIEILMLWKLQNPLSYIQTKFQKKMNSCRNSYLQKVQPIENYYFGVSAHTRLLFFQVYDIPLIQSNLKKGKLNAFHTF